MAIKAHPGALGVYLSGLAGILVAILVLQPAWVHNPTHLCAIPATVCAAIGVAYLAGHDKCSELVQYKMACLCDLYAPVGLVRWLSFTGAFTSAQ